MFSDPYERRAYAARLKWLAAGTALQAWSLEYRRGLTGRFDPRISRSSEEPEEILHCPVDCGANAPLSHLYERRYIYQLNESISNTITGATLMAGSLEAPFFIRESISWPFESIVSHGLDIPEPKKVAAHIAQPAFVFPSTTNYYHWLIEELPLLLRANEEFANFQLLVNNESKTEKHVIVAAQLQKSLTPVPLIVKIKHHIMPGRANDSWFIHPNDHERLYTFGRELTDAQSQSVHKKVYVSRRNSQRSLPMESQLEDLLKKSGFFIAHLETMPWLEQIRLFQGATLVAGPHGAGLSNLVFTPKGTTVVEFTNGYHYNRCFEWISHVGKQTYRKIDADANIESLPPQEIAKKILEYA